MLFRRRKLKPGDSFPHQDGGVLTYLGTAPDKWKTLQCDVCKAPATDYKTTPPWPGTSYAHTAMTCEAHLSYLDNHAWSKTMDGPWTDDGPRKSFCAYCSAEYGQCEHTEKYAAISHASELQARRGKISGKGL